MEFLFGGLAVAVIIIGFIVFALKKSSWYSE